MPITLEMALALLALATGVLTAGRVVFRTEVKVEAAEKGLADLDKKVDKMHENHAGKIAAHDAIASEGKAAHMALLERVTAQGAVLAEKASVESVQSVAASVDHLRREIVSHLDRIEKKLDARSRE